LFEGQKGTAPLSAPDPRILGVLTDSDVVYYDYYDASSVDLNDNQDQFNIFFRSRKFEEIVGHIEVIVKYTEEIPTRLHIESLYIRPIFQEQGLGKKCMAILEDIARRKGIKHISLSALPERVSYYLGLNAPYTIADNANGSKRRMFNVAYTNHKAKGNTNEVARKKAGDSIIEVSDGEPLVEMTKVLPRKSRTSSKTRKNRKTRKTRKNLLKN